MDVLEKINNKLENENYRNNSKEHEHVASFTAGYNVGYRQALMDLKRMLSKEEPAI